MDIFELAFAKKLGGGSGSSGGVTIKNQDKTFTENGSYSADSGYTGLGVVKVDVQPKNQDKNITENGTYTADEGYTGLGTVTVDVPTGGSGMTDTGADIYVVYGGQLYDLFVFASVAFPDYGVTREQFVICVIDELPVLSTWVSSIGAFYVIKDSGLKYMRNEGIWVDFPTFSGLPDHGWITKSALESLDYTNDANIGVYAVERVCNPFVERNIKEYVSNDKIVGQYAFSECQALTSVDLPNATSIGNSGFFHCAILKSVNLPNATSIGGSAFSNCQALTSVDLPNATSIGYNGFSYCTALKSVNLPNATSIGGIAFYHCQALASVIIGTPSVCQLANTAAFSGTPVANSQGYIYVPANLVDSYKAATNWSTYADKIKAIEE